MFSTEEDSRYTAATKEMAALLAEAKEANNGTLTPAEVKRFDALDAECESILICSGERKTALTPNARKTEPDSGNEMLDLDGGGGGIQYTSNTIRGGRGRTYRELFGTQSLSNDGFGSFEKYIAAVHSGRHHPSLRPIESLGHAGGTDSSGGFFVPDEYAAAILDSSLESEIVRPRASITPMNSDTKKIAGLDTSTASGNTLFGGFNAQWTGEGDAATEETTKSRKIELHAHKLFLYTLVSNELLHDGVGFDEQLTQAMIRGAGWFLDYAFLRGSGAGQPLGVLNDPALVTVAKETGQAASTIVYSNLTKMFARLHPASVSNSVWVANSTSIPQLLALSVSVGDGGSHIPVLSDATGDFTMLTRPVIFTEKLQTLGTTGDILLCDFSQYQIGIAADVALDRSMHVGFTTDETGYRTIVRADGQGLWSSSYTPANGDTQSWCVALATRA